MSFSCVWKNRTQPQQPTTLSSWWSPVWSQTAVGWHDEVATGCSISSQYLSVLTLTLMMTSLVFPLQEMPPHTITLPPLKHVPLSVAITKAFSASFPHFDPMIQVP